jgi:molybdopterin molybdotransferase
MISVEQALDTVLESSGDPEKTTVRTVMAAGLVLAEDVLSDIDMPPFDRSAMDGFAVSGEAGEHRLLEEITAGDARPVTLKPGVACPIMTGAPVPEGADRVVMVEHSRVDGGILRVESVPVEGANICWRGEDIRKGDVVLSRGTRLSGQHLGIAAMAGRGVLQVFSRPGIGVVTTGNEVVPATWVPSPGKVRNANLPLMESILSMNGFTDTVTLHSADDPDSLRETYSQLLDSCGVLVTAGGVSMGTRDFVPSVLESLGVDLLFTEVAQKPGKPLTFGVGPDGQPVFGLPGNPVSVLVSMEEYVLPLLRRRSGLGSFRKRTFCGRMMSDFEKNPGRLFYLRVKATGEDGTAWTLHLPKTSGSGDLMSASAVNALALAGKDLSAVSEGDLLPFHFLSTSAGELSFE